MYNFQIYSKIIINTQNNFFNKKNRFTLNKINLQPMT